MNAILIKFPFSSSNDEQYELILYSARTTAFAKAISAMNADSRSFRFVSTETVGSNTVTTYEGTLVGDVTSEDDGREDVFEPMVASKLKFSMMCQTFPTWLMDICDYYTNVKVVLSVKRGAMAIERWRGYLMANTLNMTVVDELMACPLVAVDEVGIAKYLKFRENYTSSNASPTLIQLFDYYWNMHVTSGVGNSRFDELYSLLGITMRNSLFLSRDMRYTDGSDNEVLDLLGLTVNLERYFLDRDATWESVFTDICEYLGVTFCIGSKDNGGNDCYMLSGTDYKFYEYLTYTFGSSVYARSESRAFEDFGNQFKVGSDFQMTYKPDEWKGVKVTSTPERPPVHTYLGKDNIKAIEPASGHDQWCESRIGRRRDSSQTTIDDYKYRVFQYTKIVNKEGQWIDEEKYVHLENCRLSEEGTAVGVSGYFPYNYGGQGNVKPQPTDVDSMDFALSKRGMITAKIGTYETPRQKVSADLTDYFLILNNLWGRLYWNNDTTVEAVSHDPELLATFTPFADDSSIRPDNQSYLTIDMTAMFLNENIGEDIRIVDNGSLEDDLEGTIQSVFPMTESVYDWAAGTGNSSIYTGDLEATASNIVFNLQFCPVIIMRLSIGNHYWDGTQWVYSDTPSSAPTFEMCFVPTGSTEKYWVVTTGYMHGHITNYYYQQCKTKLGASENVFRVPLAGLSEHGSPLCGNVKLEVFGPVHFVNGYQPQGGTIRANNILFVLLSDIRMEFTDEAFFSEEDIDTVAVVETDAASTTKKTKEVEIGLSTPKVDGVFNNCLLYDDGSKWVNLQHVHRHGGAETTPEAIKAREMASVFSGKQEFAEFSRFFKGFDTDNIYNVGFTVRGLTEGLGIFMPLTRKFNWTKGTVRWNLQRVADGGRSFNGAFNKSYNV